jgi:hypothetical protein
MATSAGKRQRLPVTLSAGEWETICRAAGGAGLKPATWARAALLRAAERSEAVVVARAGRLIAELEVGLPGGAAHAAAVRKHRREGWYRGRR